jgi:hypothetical protein
VPEQQTESALPSPCPEAQTPSGKRVFHSLLFEDWLKRTLGFPHSPLHTLESATTIWTFVVKMHAIVEAAINHLLIVRLNDPKLGDVITKLPTNDQRKGKMAFVKAYNLLSEDSCLFVGLFSKIRNAARFTMPKFQFGLNEVCLSTQDDEKPLWRRAFSSWWVPFPDPQHEAWGRQHFETALEDCASPSESPKFDALGIANLFPLFCASVRRVARSSGGEPNRL